MEINKQTVLVLGASENPERYSNIAIKMLNEYKHTVIAHGKTAGKINETSIQTIWPEDKKVDTVTLYLNPTHQQKFYESIIALAPKRVIFNPGTENDEFEAMLTEKGIEPIEACTLVMLRTGQF